VFHCSLKFNKLNDDDDDDVDDDDDDDDKANGVKFCTTVYWRPRQGISHFGELCFHRSRKSDGSASARATPTGM